ncbi:hypothetical protein CRI77_17070 [Mycolicibacterium duvalii]|uniref:Uncharacterized protein n=1 Tax=Mycolicibacterium duvalii TaxID=39688 RepID=A0A7I7K300_9MYCO|nr:type VII secretion target [Mycolicibacterium duvalii]MCV7367971.1 ESX-1 secretion-associated protein [Mycolicibacterium duvalii]PEG39029.1 hypothetical protein CRI77_17070 [Mycolicibacterium duvalii]BBX18437.1 hypothetical protein MDUV_32970 [Mycolicibacterium duvalii]
MGTSEAAHVDAAAVRAVAREYDVASTLIDTVLRNQLSTLGFGGATAGRAYLAQGEQLQAAVETLSTALRQWSRAAAEIAAVLRAGADRYHDADLRAAQRVR